MRFKRLGHSVTTYPAYGVTPEWGGEDSVGMVHAGDDTTTALFLSDVREVLRILGETCALVAQHQVDAFLIFAKTEKQERIGA